MGINQCASATAVSVNGPTHGRSWNIQLAKQQAMVRCQRRIVESPPVQVVEVPLGYGEVCSDFHPMPLCFEITMHWWALKARIPPESHSPPIEPSYHEYERQDDPLRSASSGWPQKCGEREWRLAKLRGSRFFFSERAGLADQIGPVGIFLPLSRLVSWRRHCTCRTMFCLERPEANKSLP